MNATYQIKECIASIIEDSDASSVVGSERITANEILTTLVECGVIDVEYKLYDADGNFDHHNDLLAQKVTLREIERQLSQ